MKKNLYRHTLTNNPTYWMKTVLLTVVSIALSTALANAQSPTAFGKRVKGLPAAYQRPNETTNMVSEQTKTSLPWIVFSDRVGNHTTTSPGGSLMMEQLDFLQPFYISEEKDGYVKLLKYQDNMVKGLKLKNKKSAESVGWIAKDKLLLWQKSFSDARQGFPYKYLTIINEADPLINPNFYVSRADSLPVYDSPDLKNAIEKVALHEYIYIFKKSPNGRQYLVGTSDQFVTRHSDRFIKGWISAAAVENWGSKVYLVPASFSDHAVARGVQQMNDLIIGNDIQYSVDPLLDTNRVALTGVPLPVSQNNSDIKTTVAVDVYNKNNNRLLTINGSELTFSSFVNLIKSRSKVNITFVIDGGGTMKGHFPSLLSTLQSLESGLSTAFDAGNVHFGSVVYRSRNSCGSGTAKLDLTSDYRRLMSFLKDQAEYVTTCDRSEGRQPVFEGLNEAINLVSNVPQQTNLFIVIGSTGNLGGANNAEIGAMARRIADVDGRLLVMQAYNSSAAPYNDYIIEGRKLVSQEAYYAAEMRKFQLVQGESFGAQVYDFNITDSISYYLDFPKASLIQGGVVFPSRGSSLQGRSYQAAVSRFINETKLDIKNHLHSLDSAFRLTGIENRNISQPVRDILRGNFNERVGDNMPHNSFKYAAPVRLNTANLHDSLPAGLSYQMVLNQNEYNDLIDVLHILVGGNLQADDARFRKKLQANYSSVFEQRRERKVSAREISNWTLAAYMENMFGIPKNVWGFNQYTVKALSNNKTMPLREFENYMIYLQSTIANVKNYAQGSGKFTANGETYYRLPGYLFTPKPTEDGSN